jgi:hypothetical protein
MAHAEIPPTQYDFFDGTEWESLETKERNMQELLKDAFEEVRKKLAKCDQGFLGGLIASRCEYCGCTEYDVWGYCKQCGKSPHILYK